MELSFVISALRRRFWLVTLFALLGSLPGLSSDKQVSDSWESTAVLNIQPPTRANVNLFSTNPDRYVLGQLSVLESEELAAQVATEVSTKSNQTITVPELRQIVEIKHKPETDVVEISTTADSAEKAKAISQSYADLYVAGLATTETDTAQKEQLDNSITTLKGQLDQVDQQLQASMKAFLPTGRKQNPDPIPPPDVVDPASVSQRQQILAELIDLQAQRNNLALQSNLKVNTEIIDNAPLPLEPKPARGNFVLAGGLLAGAVAGVIVALLWARFSTKVLDEVSAGDILGAPVVCDFPHYRSLARNPLAAFQALPRSAVPTVDQLCVRAEALAQIGEPLVVAVTGTTRSAGSTTLALAMAERFAAGGASVVVIDGDVRDPRMTALFNATADGGVPAVIANDGALTDHRGRSAFTRTMDPAVSVLGLGPNRGSAALRRDTVPAVLGAARRKAEVVVVDGGPVLDLASTLHFAALADAVVLAVPLARQKADALLDLARQLDPVRAKLLPVVTSPSRRAARGEVVGSDGTIVMPGAGTSGGAGATRPLVAADAPAGVTVAAPTAPRNPGESNPDATGILGQPQWTLPASGADSEANGDGPTRPVEPGWGQQQPH
jgi:Mrp family chromosome partitioning ATPase/capsular polysaccharide biosynthesis protein